ncbi:glycoside hydrolase family 9 protein, partial [Salmonella enterica]
YQENPPAFGDDFDIPESGNGVPDILDEVRWETDWLEKMQFPDGSAALKVGETVYAAAAPPSSDRNTRYYIPSCTSSTIAVAGMFA